MPTLYWLRHGDTEVPTNREGGSVGTSLSTSGRSQVARRAESLAAQGIRPQLILSSTIRRAVESADLVADVIGYDGKIKKDPLFNEHGLSKTGDESYEQLWERAQRIRTQLMRHKGTVLVVAHGRVGLYVVKAFMGRRPDDNPRQMAHAQLVRLWPSPTLQP